MYPAGPTAYRSEGALLELPGSLNPGAHTGYASMVHLVVDHPERWLGLDEEPPETASGPVKVVHEPRERLFGDITPASVRWHPLPARHRVGWWVTRIGASAGVADAAPRFAGVLGDRLPFQAALGASAAGLAVGATAHELGVSDPDDWVPLLEVQDLLDDRPRGSILFRAAAKPPVVGARGWLDERSAIGKASKTTTGFVAA